MSNVNLMNSLIISKNLIYDTLVDLGGKYCLYVINEHKAKSRRSQLFYGIANLEDFLKFMRKNLRWRLSFYKVVGLNLQS